jgi:glycosyltransferase involved in cell wall biosynthesis
MTPTLVEELNAAVAEVAEFRPGARRAARPAELRRTILHVAAPPDGGVPRYVANLVRDQLERGWLVAVASPAEGDLERLLADTDAVLVPWAARRTPGPSVLGETTRLRGIVDDLDPEIVHLHSAKAGLAGRLALRGERPTIFTPHAWSFEAVEGLTRSAAVAWERYAARWADAVVCVSEAERLRGAESFDARWRVALTGVDLETFAGADEEGRWAARARLGLGPSPMAVCVGRLCEQKGQDVLLRAWPSVLERVPDAELVLVGDGPNRAEQESLAGPGVTFVGARDDVADWLAASDVVVQPSRWEGMSIVMLEAMACGRSLVMTDVDGAREGIDGNGEVVPVEDSMALADAVAERLADPALTAAEGREARRRAETLHDFRTTADAVADVYADVLRARSAPVPAAELAAPVA